jgi:hypothetical protein
MIKARSPWVVTGPLEFGPMRMADILPEHVREWITKMQARGASAWTIQYCKYSILNSIFTTAVQEDRVITFHPSRGVRTPTVPSKPRQIITRSNSTPSTRRCRTRTSSYLSNWE